MGLTDNVALSALMVSFIALMITTVQPLQKLLGTGEGYRRCAKLMIGPWHRLRWRRWVWGEFRYETHFVTPKILLYSEDDPKHLREMTLPLVKAVQEQLLPLKS
jgi:hypothetical protein